MNKKLLVIPIIILSGCNPVEIDKEVVLQLDSGQLPDSVYENQAISRDIEYMNHMATMNFIYGPHLIMDPDIEYDRNGFNYVID